MDHKRIFFSLTVEIRYVAEYDTQCFETKYIIYTKKERKKERKTQEKNPQNKQMKKKINRINLNFIIQ